MCTLCVCIDSPGKFVSFCPKLMAFFSAAPSKKPPSARSVTHFEGKWRERRHKRKMRLYCTEKGNFPPPLSQISFFLHIEGREKGLKLRDDPKLVSRGSWKEGG